MLKECFMHNASLHDLMAEPLYKFCGISMSITE